MEKQVPQQIQKLLQRLEENSESDSQASKSITRSIDVLVFRDVGCPFSVKGPAAVYLIDNEGNKDSFRVPWAQQWRLTVLTAVGSCTTLRTLRLIGALTSKELEAVLTPLQSSSILESLTVIENPFTFKPEESINNEQISVEERVWIVLGNILGTSCTLEGLMLSRMALSDAGAQHLASGLRGNSDSALQILSLGRWQTPSVAKQVAEIILAAPKLSELNLEHIGVLTEDGIKALVKALALKTSLIRLGLGDVERGGSALLLESLTEEGCNKSISTLDLFGFIDGLGDCLPILLSSIQTLKTFRQYNFERTDLSPIHSRNLGQSFCSNTSITKLLIGFDWFGIMIGGKESLREFFRGANIKKPLIDLFIHSRDMAPYNVDDLSGSSFVSDVVISNLTSIRSLALRLYWQSAQREQAPQVEKIFQALENNSTIQELQIQHTKNRYWSRAWKQLFVSLRYNTTITILSFHACTSLGDDEFKDLMGVLQVNITLKRIELTDTSWKDDGKAALIQEALTRNAEQESYFSVLGGTGAKLEFEGAKAARLFLCGSPLAGKTKLRQTLTRVVRGTGWLGEKFAELLRTKGIEVEVLRDDQHMQITVWDLAGQCIFRTLQGILFPRTNQTCMFLFVFSVYDEVKGCMKEDLDESFKTELEEWLRFIASNLQITGRTLPKVLIVISHMDKMKVRSTRWAEIIVEELRADFEDVLDLCSSERLYQMDARRKKEVAPLKDFIFDTFRELLQNKSPIVPKVCSRLNSALGKRTKHFRNRPIWKSQDFYEFCLNSLREDDIPFPALETENRLKVLKAVTSYLHDTGSVIAIPNLDWIIVDPNWLTNVFLGELISMGHNFQVRADTVSLSEAVPISSKSGFVSCSVLDQLLSSFIRKHREVTGLNEKFLEELLIQLDLCYKVEGGSVSARYYIPTIVCEDPSFVELHSGRRLGARREPLEWSSAPENNQEFVGFRVQCENPRRMNMTAALFPRFQIHSRHKLMTEMDLTDGNVICSRNYMDLHMDGHEIFVERSDFRHVDVMVKCSPHKSRETAVKYVKEHIIDELRTFSASPKGCPGIILVVGIIQTKCVEKLVPWDCRGDHQAILVDKLMQKLEVDIWKQVKEMKLESWSEKINTLLNYEHSWPAIPGYLPSTSELVRKLLSDSELESAITNVVEMYQQHLTTLDHISEQMSEEIDKTNSIPKAVSNIGSINVSPEEESSSSMNTSVRTDKSQKTLGSVLSKIDRLQRRMEDRFDSLETAVGGIDKHLVSIISLQDQFQSTLSTFNSKVDRMIGYAESLERSRTPRRPYLSIDNVPIFQKVVAVFQIGTAVKLHLMCESSTGPHTVKDQPGLLLCLEKENMEWLKCILGISLKMMFYIVKAGLHVTLGLGQAVPDPGSVDAALPVSIVGGAVDRMKIDDSILSVEKSGNMTVNEAWNRLRSVLAPKLENNYTTLFKLYKVKYLTQGDGGYAWVCDQCMARGDRNKSLQCL